MRHFALLLIVAAWFFIADHTTYDSSRPGMVTRPRLYGPFPSREICKVRRNKMDNFYNYERLRFGGVSDMWKFGPCLDEEQTKDSLQ